jgi:hypothetical protein
MNKRKRAEQAPPPKDHSLSQVKQVALMLYAQRPFPLNSILSEFELNRLVWRANDLLDKLNEVCGVVARQRKAGKRSPEKNAETHQKAQNALPDVVPFNEAVMNITGEKHRHVKRAKTKFETVLYGNARELGYAKQEIDAKLAHWREHGMSRDEAIWRRSLWNEKEYRRYRIATAGSARKRKPRTKAWRERAIGQKIKEWPPGAKTEFREFAKAELAKSAARKAKKAERASQGCADGRN